MADPQIGIDDFMDFKDPFFEAMTALQSRQSDHAGMNITQAHVSALQTLLLTIKKDCEKALVLLDREAPPSEIRAVQPESVRGVLPETLDRDCVEGFFDGQNMQGQDGKQYVIPANYASKSKLVEGDGMKVTIGTNGSFIYKQIQLIARRRVVGSLAYDQELRAHVVRAEERCWRVLSASISFYRAEGGDEVVLLVPEGRDSSWAAIDNVIKKI